MTTALAWFNDIIQWIGRWVPRITMIRPTHRGIRFGPKGGTVAVGPGVVIYWPILYDLIQMPITTISFQAPGQTLAIESDGIVPIVAHCAVAVQFQITDPVKAAMRALNFLALVDNRVQAAVACHWRGNIRDLAWCDAARADASSALREYGIRLERLDVTNLARGCVVKYVSDWSHSDNAQGRRPDDGMPV